MKKTTFVPVLSAIIIMAVFAVPVNAYNLDESTCISNMGGSWSDMTCTVSNVVNSNEITILPGTILSINTLSSVFNNSGIINNNNGTIKNNGTINNNNVGIINNNGTIYNGYAQLVSVFIGNSIFKNGTINNYGNISNNNGGHIYNFDIINNNYGNISNNNGGYILSDDTGGYITHDITLHGIINNNFGNIYNFGTFLNLAYIYNFGTINNFYNFYDTQDAKIYNFGTINNNFGGFINVDASYLYNNGGTINNNGTFRVWGMLYNGGTINNNGTIINTLDSEIYNGYTINNNGDIYNDGIYYNFGVIRNNGTTINNGTISNYYGFINNNGTINNYNVGTINNGGPDNNGTINNYNDATINNIGNINNNDTINNFCGGSIIETNPISGNPVQNEICIITPPTGVPAIISFSPLTSNVMDTVGANRTFNIIINQTVNVSWKINETEVFNETGVTTSLYISTNAALGAWNVTAVASNANGTAIKKWDWNVTITSQPIQLSIVAPADITKIMTGSLTTIANLGTPTVTGGTPPYTIGNNASAGGFPVGITTVTWTVTDSNDGTATDTQLVTLKDEQITPPPPVPEMSTMILMTAGMLGLFFIIVKNRR